MRIKYRPVLVVFFWAGSVALGQYPGGNGHAYSAERGTNWERDVIFAGPVTISTSNFAYDNMSLLVNGTTVTVDGAHTFQNVGVTNGGKITHTEGDTNGLQLTVSGTLTVATNSSIDVSGRGNGDGGVHAYTGGSYGGRGGNCDASNVSRPCFGDCRQPLSCGGGGVYTRGGGRIKVTAEALQLDGQILANGICPGIYMGGSAGGAIWLDVGTLRGGGVVQADGGSSPGGGAGGGGGRIAIYYDSANEFNLTNAVRTWGGLGKNNLPAGGGGTIYLKNKGTGAEQLWVNNAGVSGADTELGLQAPGLLLLVNNALVTVTGALTVASISGTNAVITQDAAASVPNLVMGTNSTWVQNAELTRPGNAMAVSGWTWSVNYSQTWASVTVTNGGKITHPAGNANGLILTVDGPLNVAANASIDVSGCGGTNGSLGQRVGGSYGGRGGQDGTNESPAVYGSLTEPMDLGGGSRDYRGGGCVRLTANSLHLDGLLKANGSAPGANIGSPAGGSVWIDVVSLDGEGTIEAQGGPVASSACGGGGGRIAVYYTCATRFDLNENVSAAGSAGQGGYESGSDGTIYRSERSEPPVLDPIGQKVAFEGNLIAFQITASDLNCTIPLLSVTGLPVAAVFEDQGNGTGSFSWQTQEGAYGVYLVRFVTSDGARSSEEIVKIYVGHIGEPLNEAGIPESLASWGLQIKDLESSTSSGNATVAWDTAQGILYEVYYSDSPVGAGMSWQKAGATVEGDGGECQATDTGLGTDNARRYYQVVLPGETPRTNNLWGVIRRDVPAAGYTLISPPLRMDRRFDGELGAALADSLQGNDGGLGSGADELHILQDNGSWRTLYLDASGIWREVNGAVSEYELPEGRGLWVARKVGAPARFTFTGPVGNDGTRTNRIVTGWNILGLSEGKELPLKATLAGANPVSDGAQEDSDQLVFCTANGAWRRLMYIQGWGAPYDGNWLDLSTFQLVTTNEMLEPGAAYYYLRQGSATEIQF